MDEIKCAQEYSKSIDNITSQNNPIFGQVNVGNVLPKDEYKPSSLWTNNEASYKSNLWTNKAGKRIPFINELYMWNLKNGKSVEHEEIILTWTS